MIFMKAWLLILLFFLPGLALGLPEDRDQPIYLEADRAQLDQDTETSIYIGNVIITQGSMRLTADSATIYMQNGVFQRMEAEGAPATFRYQPAADKEEIHGVGLRANYDAINETLEVTGDASFKQGEDTFNGDFIEYDLRENLVKARSKAGGRVKFTIQPETFDSAQPQ